MPSFKTKHSPKVCLQNVRKTLNKLIVNCWNAYYFKYPARKLENEVNPRLNWYSFFKNSCCLFVAFQRMRLDLIFCRDITRHLIRLEFPSLFLFTFTLHFSLSISFAFQTISVSQFQPRASVFRTNLWCFDKTWKSKQKSIFSSFHMEP